jgi:ligand-binding sensor domain-containing protein
MGAAEPRTVARTLTLSVWLLLVAASTSAEQLPIRTYTTADGLAEDNVMRIVRDSRGFLWFCTGEGLSRFDGYQFKNYSIDQGLPHRVVNDLLETRDGNYWVATGGGVSRFNPTGTALFTT